MFTIGFIGTGNMGSALAQAAAKQLDPSEIALANRTAAKAEALAAHIGGIVTDDVQIAARSRFIMLGVKPQMMADVLDNIAVTLKQRTDRFVLVTMAAGLTIDRIREMAGGDYPVIRIMPNTPCKLGAGVTLCCRNESVTDAEFSEFHEIFKASGVLTDLPEDLMDAGCAISGCGPAFVYTFIDAMANAGITCGLAPEDALSLAAATALGSARMVLSGNDSPSVLREHVCSPGGATIEGVKKLESGEFRAAVADCIIASFERTKELGK